MEQKIKDRFTELCESFSAANFNTSWSELKGILNKISAFSFSHSPDHYEELNKIAKSISKEYPKIGGEFVTLKTRVNVILNEINDLINSQNI